MENSKVIVPPIKCQGIKTKIVPFIKEKVERNTDGVWIEPFVGTGVVAFNMAPQKAILCDKNQYIIALYQFRIKNAMNMGLRKGYMRDNKIKSLMS